MRTLLTPAAIHRRRVFLSPIERRGAGGRGPHPIVGRLLASRPIAATLIVLASLVLLAAAAPAECPDPAESSDPAESPDPAKPTSHTVRHLEGWKVRVDDRLLAPPHEDLGRRALRFLEYKLSDIAAVVAGDRLEKLRAVTIVVDLSHGKLGSIQYHPSAGWLRANGYSTDLEKCVHIPRAADLPTRRNISEQPWVILHELAHAYHDQVLGFDEPRIREAYERFKRSGRGDAALLYDGRRVRHYGLTDAKEFFAEMTEAYFGMNDFFPFNRAELMTAEREIHELMRAIWEPDARARGESLEGAAPSAPAPGKAHAMSGPSGGRRRRLCGGTASVPSIFKITRDPDGPDGAGPSKGRRHTILVTVADPPRGSATVRSSPSSCARAPPRSFGCGRRTMAAVRSTGRRPVEGAAPSAPAP